MRVAIFTDTYLPDINGVATSTHILCSELKKHNHQVLVVTTELPEGSNYQDEGNVIRVPGLDLKKIYGYRMAAIYSFSGMKEIREFEPEVIHIQTEFGVGIFGKIVGEMLDVPVCYTYHTMWRDYSHYLSGGIHAVDHVMKKIIEKISKVYGNSCSQLIVPSLKTKEALESYGIDNNISVIPTGLELDRFIEEDHKKVEEIKTQYNLHNKFVITFLGRIAPEKSVDFVMDALKDLLEEHDDMVLMIVGGGPQLDELKDYANSIGLKDHVIFTGAADPKDVPSYYHASTLFVSASTTETQGLTYIEAMASGLPVLARYDKNLEDVIIDGANGFFFETEEELSKRVEDMYKMDLSELSKNAVENSDQFSSTNFYNKIINVYNKAINTSIYRYVVQSIEEDRNKKFNILIGYDSHHIKISATEDTIKRYGLAVGCEINREELDALRDLEKLSLCYNQALKYLSYHDYSYAKMAKKLSSKGYDELVVDMAMDILMNKGLIDDYEYSLSYIRHYLKLGYGLNKAAYNLKKEGIKPSIIDEALNEFSDDLEFDKAVELVSKLYNANTTRSPQALIASIKNKLFNKGFSEDIVSRAMDEVDMQFTSEHTKMLLEKEYDRVFRRYAHKFEGSTLKNKLITFLVQKGYSYEDVLECVGEKWKEE